MSFRNTGRGRKAVGLKISRNPTYLDTNNGQLIDPDDIKEGQSVVIHDVIVSSGNGKLGTAANGEGDFLTNLNSKHNKLNVKVPEGKGVYTNIDAYITITYDVVDTNPVSPSVLTVTQSSSTTTTAAATTTTTQAPTLNIYFTSSGTSTNEGNSGTSTHGVTVSRSNGTGVATVRWYTVDDTAIAGTDYVSASGTLQFSASVTTLQINITINGDTILEGDEAFKIYLDDASGGLNTTAPTWEIGGVAQSTPNLTTRIHTVTITNDDIETKFVDGSIPDWMQPLYYETNGHINAGDISNSTSAYPSSNVILNNAWCSPTAAACQLGHLNSMGLTDPTAASGHVDGISDLFNAGDLDNPDHGLPNAGTKTWNAAVGWGDYLVDGPSKRGAKNAMLGWYDYTGAGTTSCRLTDFGWFMNTNDSCADHTLAGTRISSGTATAPSASNLINLNGVGTRIHNIYLGMKDFYRHAGYSNMVGIIYHRGSDGTVASFPSGQTHASGVPEPPIGMLPRLWVDGGVARSSGFGVDPAFTWDTIKTEIDQNRTVVACFQGWNISQSSVTPSSGFPNTNHAIESGKVAGAGQNDSGYWSLDTANNGTGWDGTDYTADDSTAPPIWGGTALGHTVLIVGYISKGALDDVSQEGDTDWLIVRDNWENSTRNVIIPFRSDDPNSTNTTNVQTIRWAKDVILATVYVDQTQATYTVASPTCPHSGDGDSNPYSTTTTTTQAPGNNYYVTHCDGVTGTVVIDDQYSYGPVALGAFVFWTDNNAMPQCGEVTAVDQGGTPVGSLTDSADYGDCSTCCSMNGC